MKKVASVITVTVCILLFSCGSETRMDFSIIPVKSSGGEYQYIDISQRGKIVIHPQFSEAYIFRDGLALVKSSGKDGKYGYIDKKGKYVIAPTYNYAQDFNEGTAWVQVEDHPPMLIDKKNKMLLQIDSLTSACPFIHGIAAVTYYSDGQELGMFINQKGERAVQTTDGIFNSIINDSLYAFKSKGSEKWGYKNKEGEFVIKEQFDYAESFLDGVAVIKIGNKYGSIDKDGNYAVTPQYDSLEYDSDGLYIAKVGKKTGWINRKSEMIINPQFDEVLQFYGNKLAPVLVGKKWAYIDRKGQIAINAQFDIALPFFGDYAMIVNNDKIGFINQKGDFVVHPSYDVGDDDINEYLYAAGQKAFGLPIWYSLEYSDEKFESYEKLRERENAYEEKKRERERLEAEAKAVADSLAAEQARLELEELLAKNPSPAKTELESEAKKWQSATAADFEAYNNGLYNNGSSYMASESEIFSFEGMEENGEYGWVATSKVKIGNCPAKSVWKMFAGSEGGTNESPQKCKAITTKTITGFSYTAAERARAALEEQLAKDPNPAKMELESEARRWQSDVNTDLRYSSRISSYKAPESEIFSFEGTGGYDEYGWAATSKVKIGNCPAKSVWKMLAKSEGSANYVPSKCKTITPKVITDFNYGCIECSD